MLDTPLSVKYRPHKLTDIIGQPIVVQSITNAFKSKTLHHAYVFGGKFGNGKTLLARILAAMENCEKGVTLEPCGKCQNCIDIMSGKSTDVKEIDAASTRGVEGIRDLAKEIRYATLNCRTRYIILDEAHSLTGIAAEAALKMIEEPPINTRFILATTGPHLLKDTIQSRCITHRFHKVGITELTQHLVKISNLENVKCAEDALKLAARYSDGSVRNSLQNLQTLMNYSGGGEINVEMAKAALGAIDDKSYFNFVDSIIAVNMANGMKAIEVLLRDGKSIDDVVNGFYYHLRGLLLTKTCGSDLSSFGIIEEESKKYAHQASSLTINSILEMMSSLVDLNRGVALNLDSQILFEKYFIESIIMIKKAEAAKKK